MYLDIEMRNRERRTKNKVVYHKVDTDPSSSSESIKSNFSDSNSIPARGEDDRACKSDIDLNFGAVGPHKY